MALKIFNHNTNDLNVAGNWGPVATLPAPGDDVLIPVGQQTSIVCGATWVGIELATLTVDEACTSNICSSGAPWIVSPSKILIRGRGNFFMQNNDATPVALSYTVDATPSSTGVIPTVELSGTATTNASTQFTFLRGNITIPTSGAIARITVGQRTSTGDVRLTMSTGAGAVTTFNQESGIVTASNTLTTVYHSGGTLTKDVVTMTTYYGSGTAQCFYDFAGTIALIELRDTCVMDWLRTSGQKTATVTRLYDQSVLRYMPVNPYHVFTAAIEDYRPQAG